MKILLLGDYSNCHATLALALADMGHQVTVASDGSRWMQCRRHAAIGRRWPGKLGGLVHMLDIRRKLGGELSGYDVVAIHDPNFVDLRPERLRPLFTRLKRGNGAVFLTAMSTDTAYLRMLESPDSPLAYSEWSGHGEIEESMSEQWRAWHTPALASYHDFVYDNLSGAVSVLYEYHVAMVKALGNDRCAYGGIPIDTVRFAPQKPEPAVDENRPVRLFMGYDRARTFVKGTDRLKVAAEEACRRCGAELKIVERLPFDDFVDELRWGDVVLDQLYSYTPATTALMAMSMGNAVVSGGEDDFYDFIGEKDLRPIVNAPMQMDSLVETLCALAGDGVGALARRGRDSRRFVLKHNAMEVVARRFMDFWQSKL